MDDLNYFHSDGYVPSEVENDILNYMCNAVTSWSLGVILGSILTGEEPSQFGLRSYNVKKLIVRRMKNLRCSQLMCDLISSNYIMVPEKESGFRLFTTGKSMEVPRTFGLDKREKFTNSCRS
jgi:hypothetical protein